MVPVAMPTGKKISPENEKVYSNCEEAELFLNGKSFGVIKRKSQDFPAAELRWNVKYAQGGNILKVIARKGKIVVSDEIKQDYQSKKWDAPSQMTLKKMTLQVWISLELMIYFFQYSKWLAAGNICFFTPNKSCCQNTGILYCRVVF